MARTGHLEGVRVGREKSASLPLLVVAAFTMIVAIIDILIVILILNVNVVFVIAPSARSRHTPFLHAVAQAG